MAANVSVSEAKPPQDDDSPLAFTMEGYQGIATFLPGALLLVTGMELGPCNEQISG